MAQHYQPKHFIRQAPNKLLQHYLAGKGIGCNLPWKQIGEGHVEPIYHAFEAAPEMLRRQIDFDFCNIHGMADEAGMRTMISEARDHHHQGGLEIAEELGAMGSHIERAFWVFLEYPDVFQVAMRFQKADTLGRYWRKRSDMPPVKAAIDRDAQERLGKAITEYYTVKEGRGYACQVDHYDREGKLYWFCYPEDYAHGFLIYDEAHKLHPSIQRPAFEVIFVYSQAECSLDVYVEGDQKIVAEMQRIFGRTILGLELPHMEKPGIVYELNGLLDKNFPFSTEPTDRVEEVRIKELKLRIMGQGNRRIALESDCSDGPKAVYSLLDDVLAGGTILRDLLALQHVRIQLLFRADERNRKRTLTFEVSHPNSCSLKYDPRHITAKELLKRWGVDVSGRAENSPPKHRRSIQSCLPA